MKASILVLLSLSSFSLFAQPVYHCKSGSSVRKIEISYQSNGIEVPCVVKYTKGSESFSLWNAKHEVGYCEAKAKSLKNKLEGFGWNCAADPAGL